MTASPPYRAAATVFGAVLTVYALTLAPTVTWWDAGEFIAAARTLGIPHPPGTPLFVALAHVWALLVPVGEVAMRTNLLSACFGAAAAGFFLVVHEALAAGAADGDPAPGRLTWPALGAAAAAVMASMTFTAWQNANETEVYAVATAMIAWSAWSMLRWRATRGTPAATRWLLLTGYLLGLSVSVHLLALLAGPALVTFAVSVLWRTPAADSAQRQREMADVAVLGGLWALLVGTGLGSSTLLGVGAAGFAGAAIYAMRAGRFGFVLAALAIAALGVSPYGLLYIRAGQMPPINEADPSTWDALLAVIRRAQYPVRTPLDDPTQYHGPDNPGRSPLIIGLQLLNYVQYFDWQWAKGIATQVGLIPVRTIFTLLAFFLGLRGQRVLRRRDADSWWLLGALWLTTGLGLMAYMNFKPGASLGWPQFPDGAQHEVRERDYFFLVSFIVWGLVAGIGAADLAARLRTPMRLAALGAVALWPTALNWTAATRNGPDARLPADVAYNLLNSMPPNGILFTYGDNDTFPLWWAQEVEGVRRDVTVICIALANTDWYMRQLRDRPARPFEPAAAPAPWRARGATPTPTGPLHDLTDAMIAEAASQAAYTDRPTPVDLGAFTHVIPERTLVEPSDILTLRVVRANLGRRPIAWSVTAGGAPLGLAGRTVQQGLVFRLDPVAPDPADPRLDRSRLSGAMLDVALTDSLAWTTYRYGGLEGRHGGLRLETTSEAFLNSLSIPFTQLAYAYTARGDSTRAISNLRRAALLSDDPSFRQALEAAGQPLRP
jgi:hypothetical protein